MNEKKRFPWFRFIIWLAGVGFGIYLAFGWRDLLGKAWTNGSYLKKLALARPYPAMVVDMVDGGVLEYHLLNQVVEIALSKLRRGKRIDIGCHQAHGRTGSILACLIARIEHMNGEDAIKATRSRYCRYAIETKAQEDMVKQYAATLKRLGYSGRK